MSAAKVPISSSCISRLKPTTSAARMAARRRSIVDYPSNNGCDLQILGPKECDGESALGHEQRRQHKEIQAGTRRRFGLRADDEFNRSIRIETVVTRSRSREICQK